jgi:multiple sugar transport system permease protein
MIKKLRLALSEFNWKKRNYIRKYTSRFTAFLERKRLGFVVHWPGWLKAIFYLAPALLLLAVFTFYPIINSFLISFLEGYNIQTGEFDDYTLIGNYRYIILEATGFRQAVVNTALIVAITVPATVLISLFIAVALASIKPLKGFYQTVFFLPYITNTIAIGLVFAFMFSGNANTINTTLGLVNQILVWFGAKPIIWLGTGNVAEGIRGATYWSAMSVILIYTIWNGLAFKIIVFLSGIQGIDKQYYQAAQIDGASKSKALRRITVPLISPMIFYILITSVIGGFKTYTSVVAIINTEGIITTGASGLINLKTIVFYVYDFIGMAGINGMMSYASAAAIILFIIILMFTMVQLYVGKRRVHY